MFADDAQATERAGRTRQLGVYWNLGFRVFRVFRFWDFGYVGFGVFRVEGLGIQGIWGTSYLGLRVFRAFRAFRSVFIWSLQASRGMQELQPPRRKDRNLKDKKRKGHQAGNKSRDYIGII